MNSDLTQQENIPSRGLLSTPLRNAHLIVSPWMLALVYFINLAIAEAMTMLVAPRAGMIAHGVVFALLLLHASLAAHGSQQKFLLTLSLAPLIRVLSLAMPLIHFPLVYWYLVVGIPLFAAAFLTARQAKLSREMIGLQIRYWPLQLVIGSFGFLLGFIEYLILRPQPLVTAYLWQLLLVPALILLIFTGFLEELIFRGIMQAGAWSYLGRGALFYVAGVFALLHLGYRSILDVLFVFVVALIFGLLVPRRNGSLLGVTLAHGFTNITLYLVFPFLLAQATTSISAPPDILAPAALVTPDANRLVATPLLPALIPPSSTATPTIPTPTTTPTFTTTIASPTPTASPTNCLAPLGWVPYIVRPGDTLSTIGMRFGVSGMAIRLANCLGDPLILSPGQRLYVPNQVTQPTLEPTEEEPVEPTQPATLEPPTSEPTSTPEPEEPTDTPNPPGDTPTPAPTEDPNEPTPAPTDEPSTPEPTLAPTEAG